MPHMFYYFLLSSIFLETKHRKKGKKRKAKKGKVIQSQELDLPRGVIASYHHLSFESLGHGSKAVSLCPERNPSNSLLSQSAMMISSFDSTCNGNPNRKRKSDQEKEGRKEEKKMPTFSCSWLFIHAMSTEAKRFLGSWVLDG